MKKLTVAVAGLAALAIASNASADTTNVIYLTGASAYRAVTHSVITNMLSGCQVGWSDKSFGGASAARFVGTYNGETVEFRCRWSGSLDGIQRLVYRDDSNYNVTNWPSGGTLTPAPGAQTTFVNETGPADACMSDSYQNSTLYQEPALVDTIVGVIPFRWVRIDGAPASIANMTPLIAQQMLYSGRVPLSFFSGVATDTTYVKTAGRNADSGTRVCTFSETGFGASSPPVQQEIFVNASNAITNVVPYHQEDVLGTTYPVGQSGYGSGSTLSGLMGRTGSNGTDVPEANRCWLVAALGLKDASDAITAGATGLTWNGVAYDAEDVRNGKYTFWSHEHMFYRDDLDEAKMTVLDDLATAMQTLDPAPDGIKLDTMKVTRSVEGGVVTKK